MSVPRCGKVGRPPKDIDADQVFRLARLGLTQADIAEIFDVSQSVISERFRSEFTRARGHWKLSLRLAQWKRAKAGSDAMLIHLGKSVLGQTYKVDITTKGGLPAMVYIEAANNPRDQVQSNLESAIEAFGYVRKANNPRDEFEGNGFGDATVIMLPAKDTEIDNQ
jgi:hypothetical protein